MAQEDPFRAAVDKLKTELARFERESNQTDRNRDEWMRTFYSVRAERMRSDGERIWVTGSIFLPVAAAGFAAYVAIESPTVSETIALGLASSALAWCWLLIAEKLRSFQRKSEAWLVAIQEVLEVSDESGSALYDGKVNQWLARKGIVAWMRRTLVVAITGGWIVLVFLSRR